jgi:alpha-tubulin suppressor-like RCC1 family protein
VPGEDIGGTDWIAVFAGDNHVIAIRGNLTQQSIWTWGSDNSFGQLGSDPTRIESCSPGKLIFGGDLETADQWVAGAAGGGTSYAINSEGMLYSWGDNRAGQAGISQNLEPQIIDEGLLCVDIASGYSHSMAITEDHELFGWGNNEKGQLGDGTTAPKQAPIQIEQTIQWAQVAVGAEHTVALDIDRNLYTWGSNIFGQLGDESIDEVRNRPGPIQFKDDITPATEVWADIAAGGFFTLAINGEGLNTLWGWGNNLYYELGVSNGNFCDELDQEDDGHCRRINLALKDNQHLYAWGDNSNGQLGIDLEGESYTTEPALADAFGPMKRISAGSGTSFGVLNDGTLMAWGNNEFGQLGDGTTETRLTPIVIPHPRGLEWLKVSAGNCHVVAIDQNHHLWSWGCNFGGQLGNGQAWVTTPTRIH